MRKYTEIEEIYIYKKMLRFENDIDAIFFKTEEFLKVFSKNFCEGLGLNETFNLCKFIEKLDKFDFNKKFLYYLISEDLIRQNKIYLLFNNENLQQSIHNQLTFSNTEILLDYLKYN